MRARGTTPPSGRSVFDRRSGSMRAVGVTLFVGLCLCQPSPGATDDGRPIDPVDVLERALATVEEAPERGDLFPDLAVAFARVGRIQRAQRIADRIEQGDRRTMVIRTIAVEQVAHGDLDGGVKTANSLPRAYVRRLAIVGIAVRQAQAEDVAGAIRTINAELDGDDLADALQLLGQTLESAGDFDGAARAYAASPSLACKVRVLRASAHGRLKKGDFSGALEEIDRTPPVVRQRNAEIESSPGGGRYNVFRITPELFRDWLLAEAAVFMAKAGETDRAVKTIESITTPYLRISSAAKAAGVCAGRGESQAARALIVKAFEWAAEDGYKGFELTEIAAAQTRAKDKRARETFLNALATVGHVANQAVVVSNQARAGDLDGAVETAGAIPDEAVKEDALLSVVKAAAAAGDVARAKDVAGSLRSEAARVAAFQKVAEAVAARGDLPGAGRVIAEEVEPYARKDAGRLRAVSRLRAKVGDVRGALAWADSLASPGATARALLGVAEGLLPEVSEPNLQLENP